MNSPKYFVLIFIAGTRLINCMEQDQSQQMISFLEKVPVGVRNRIAEYRIGQIFLDKINKNENEKNNGMVDFRSVYARKEKFKHPNFTLTLDNDNSLWLTKKFVISPYISWSYSEGKIFSAEGSSLVEKINVIKQFTHMFSPKKQVFCFAVSENRKFAMYLTAAYNDETGYFQTEELNTIHLETNKKKVLVLKNNPNFDEFNQRWNTQEVASSDTAKLAELEKQGYKSYSSKVGFKLLFKSKIIAAAVTNNGSKVAFGDHLGITLFDLDKQSAQVLLHEKFDFPGILLFDKTGKKLGYKFDGEKEKTGWQRIPLRIISIEKEPDDQLEEYLNVNRVSKTLPYRSM